MLKTTMLMIPTNAENDYATIPCIADEELLRGRASLLHSMPPRRYATRPERFAASCDAPAFFAA